MKRPFDGKREYDPKLDLQIGNVRIIGYHVAMKAMAVIAIATIAIVLGLIVYGVLR